MRLAVSVGISLFFLLFYYGMIGYTLKRCNVSMSFKELNKAEIFLIFGLVIGLISYFCILCAQEIRIPNWDSGFYWIKSLNFENFIWGYPEEALIDVYQSIDLTDYSDVIPMVISLPFHFFGRYSYVAYCIQLFIMFQVPAYFVITEAVITVLRKLKLSFKNMHLLVLLCSCSLSFIYIPTIYGLFDSADLLIAAAIVLLLLNMDYKKFVIKDDILLSVLFLSLLFIRRHFSFFALGYFVCYLLVEFIQVIRYKEKAYFYGFMKNSLLIGGICVGILLLFFRNYLVRTLANNYAEAYSVWSYGTMLDKFYATFSYIGWFVILFAAIGIVWLFLNKKGDIIFTQAVSIIFTLLMFFRIQSFSKHHYYNITVQLIILVCIGIIVLPGWCKSRKIKRIVTGLEIIILSAVFAHGLIPSVKLPNKLNLLPSLCFQPEKREDMPEIGKLIEDVNALTSIEEGKMAYCVSSSELLNEDILRNYNLPDELNALPALYMTYHADLAHGFPEPFLMSDIIITTNPSQTHLNYDGQRVIWVLNDLMNERNGILADNFEIVSTYELGPENNKFEVIVYQKIKEFERTDYEYLIDLFNQWYADYPDLFQERIEEFY